MTAPLWMPGVQRLPSSHAGNPMVGGAPRVVWHRTVGQGFAGNASFLKAEGFEPHILWDPTTGEIGQFLPANVGAYALEHPAGSPQTNRMGTFCIQIEVADHGQTWDITSTKMLGWPSLRAWLRSLSIPEVWPGGAPPPLGSRAEVDAATWARAGHFSHSQVPANHHTDPGRMDLAKLFPGYAPHVVQQIAAAGAKKPQPTPIPAPSPSQEDADVAVIVKDPDGPKQYVTNWLTKRWIEDVSELADLEAGGVKRAAIKATTLARIPDQT